MVLTGLNLNANFDIYCLKVHMKKVCINLVPYLIHENINIVS